MNIAKTLDVIPNLEMIRLQSERKTFLTSIRSKFD